jgi:hypothetical protein
MRRSSSIARRAPVAVRPPLQTNPSSFPNATDDGSQHGSGHLRRESRSDLDDGGDPTVMSR